VTYVFEDLSDEDAPSRQFKTLRGATNHGCRVFRSSGYLHRDD